MTYLKYSNLCADMVRAALKEGPIKVKAKAREVVYFRQSTWKNGQPEKQGAPPCAVCTVGVWSVGGGKRRGGGELE